MSLISYKLGQGSIVLRIKIFDSTVSTGAGKTGLSYNTSGLIISTIADNEASATVYTNAASHTETISTLGTYAAPSASCCRFKEVDSTNHKGVYEIQIADARFNVSNAKSLLISVSGMTGAAECDVVIPLIIKDPYSASTDQTGDSYAKVNDATIGLSNLKALIDALQADIGDASASTLGSLYAILGNAAASLSSRTPSGTPGANNGAITTNGTKINQTVDLTAGQKIAATLAAADVTGNVPANVLQWNSGSLPTVGTSTLAAADVWNYATRTLSAFSFSVAISTAAQNALVAAIEVELANDATGQAFMQAIADKIAADWTTGDVSVAAIATAVRDAILNRVLAGNHDTTGTPGKLLQNADAAVSSRSTFAGGAVASVTAPVTVGVNNDKTGYSLSTPPPTAEQIKIALEENGGKLDHLWETTEDDAGVRRFTANALEQAPAGGGSGATPEDIDAQLTSSHGSGSWGAGGSIVFPVMQGMVYTATAQQAREVVIVRGDTPRIPFDLGADYTGWTPRFGAKATLGDTEYCIGPKVAAWIDATAGKGYIDLSSTEAAETGRLFAEIDLCQGTQRLTAMKFYLKIVEDVIKE